MKKILLLLLLSILFCLAPTKSSAQTGTHSVDLSWTQGTCSGCTITGNNVYRSTTSGSGYILIKSFSTPATSYTDPSLPQLTTYYYVVTATCLNCTTSESGYSNQVTATTLADTKPGAASNLTAVAH